MKTKQVLICVGLLLLTGCTTHRSPIPYIPYNPSPSTTITSPKAIIEQVISEQPPGYAPAELIMTDNYFRMTMYRRGIFKFTGVTFPTTVYYSNIGSVTIHIRRKWYYVTIWDKGKASMCRIVTSQEDQAKSFIDALYMMMGQNIPKPPK